MRNTPIKTRSLKALMWVGLVSAFIIFSIFENSAMADGYPGFRSQVNFKTSGEAPNTNAVGSQSAPGRVSVSSFRGNPIWNNSETRTCGQACAYDKANESISLDLLYTYKRIKYLDKSIESAEEAEKSSIVKENLGNFCTSSEIETPDKYDGEKICLARFKRIAQLRLYRMRSAMMSNSNSAASLRSLDTPNIYYPDVKRRREVPLMKDPSYGELRAQTPYVPTQDELEQEYELYKLEYKKLASEEYSNWHKGLEQKPTKDEFLAFRAVDRDPENPTGEKMWVQDRSCGLPVCYDENAWAEAVKIYEASVEDREVIRSQVIANQKLAAERVGLTPSAHLKESVGEKGILAYQVAQAAVVRKANQTLMSSKQAEVPRGSILQRRLATFPLETSATLNSRQLETLEQGTGNEKVYLSKPGAEGGAVYVTFDPDAIEDIILNEIKP